MGTLDLFLDLTAMATPSGEERLVADRVTAELRELGIDVHEDGAGAEIGGGTGNLYARLEPTVDGTPLFLCSHMDTVQPTGPIEPVVEDGVVRNGAGTILGADNKSAVVAMVETARRVVEDRVPHAGLELLFTPKEEVGLKGAQAFDCSRFVARVGYVYDQAGPIGEVILGAPNSMIMKITFTGQAAHAGMAPVFAEARETGPGHYQTVIELSMAGDWNLTVHVTLSDDRKLDHEFEIRGVEP